MGIYIKCMKMPTDCRECPMETYYNCGDTKCLAAEKLLAWDYEAIPFDGRADWCPLVEIPEPHGDLIDRDALVKDLTNGIKAGLLLDGYEKYQNINNTDDCVECVKYADAVIEAEESVNE